MWGAIATGSNAVHGVKLDVGSKGVVGSSGGCWTTDEGEEILGRSEADLGRGAARVEILEGIYPIAGPHDQQTTSFCSLLGVASSARIAPLSIGFKGRVYPPFIRRRGDSRRIWIQGRDVVSRSGEWS